MPYSSFFKLFSDFLLKNRAILVCFSLIFWVSAFLINSLFSCKNPHSAPLPLDHPHGLRIPPWALFFYHLKISAKNVISFLHGGCKRKRDEIQISRFFFLHQQCGEKTLTYMLLVIASISITTSYIQGTSMYLRV